MPNEPNITSEEPVKAKAENDPKKRLARKFGAGMPLLNSTDGVAWRRWIESQRKQQEGTMRDKRVHWTRHRHFRVGHQWISTRDGRLWREPQSDANDVRPVLNVIGPALDFRLGILAEQKPGFKHEPLVAGVAGREAAEAQQAVVEYYYHLLRAWNAFLDAWHHGQTDGVGFVHVYIDKNSGPTKQDLDLIPPSDSRFAGLQAQGYTVNEQGLLELPYADEGIPAPPDAPARMLYEGEIAHRVLLAHEVVFDPEARTINGPVDKARWAMTRRIRSIEQARLETGDSSIESETQISTQNDVLDLPMDRALGWQRGLPPFPTKRQRVTDGVPEYILWIAPDQFEPGLENGIWLRLLGNKIVERGEELPGGVIPLARFTDGSSDPDIYPRPVMSDWIGDQIAVNALLAVLIKHARWFAGGRILALKGTMLEETYSNIVGSQVEYTGSKPDVMPPVAAGADAWRLLDWLIKKLEDKTGWNDIARGQLGGTGGASAQDISGRAVLATRELFERAFGPVVRAAAEGATEWAQIVVKYAQWLYDTPRLIPAVGGRGDLAKKVDSEMLGSMPMVFVDPETLMPLPRALRQQLLEEQFDKGRISLPEYKKRSVYSDIQNVHMGDTDQWERAQFVNTQIEEQWEQLLALPPLPEPGPDGEMGPSRYSVQGGIPVLYQDLQAVAPQAQQGAAGPGAQMPAMYMTVHKPALQEIILNERRPWGMRQVALERWGVYDQLERAMNDPTGTTPFPMEVTGMPADKMASMTATPLGGVPQPGAPGEPGIAPEPGAEGATGPLTSPSPVNSPIVPQSSQLGSPSLTPNERAIAGDQQQA